MRLVSIQIAILTPTHMDIFKYSFMIRALLAGSMISVIAPMIGTSIVMRRYNFLVDTLAHIAFIGAILGYIIQISSSITTIVVVVIAGLIIEELRARKKFTSDAALSLFLYGSLGLAGILLHASSASNVQLESFLFGSIVTVQTIDVWLLLCLLIVTIVVISLSYRGMLSVLFDEEWAITSGIPVVFYNRILMLLASLTVALATKIVGVLLVGSLMILPVLIAKQWNQSFKRTFFISIASSIIAVQSGIFISYYADFPSGGTVVLCLLFLACIQPTYQCIVGTKR